MPVGEDAEQDELERIALADDRALDLVQDPLCLLRELLDGHSASSLSITRRAPAGEMPLREPAQRRLAIRADELPELLAERLLDRGAAAVEPQPLARQPLARDVAQGRAQPVVQVEGGRRAERELALEPLELRRAQRPRRLPVERLGERRACRARVRLTRRHHHLEERQSAHHEYVDVQFERKAARLGESGEHERDRGEDREE